MTETRWRQAVGLLRKGRTVVLDDGCRIVPFLTECGAAYSLRNENNCILYTPDLERIKSILFWKPKRGT